MKKFIIFFLGAGWIVVNVFFLPFFPWTSGIVRAWLLLEGYIPYRDLTWIRTPLDLFLLAGWFKLFGVSEGSYQYFIFAFLLLIAIALYIFGLKFFTSKKLLPFMFFILFLFPLFLNTEMGEVIIGFFNSLLLLTTFLYLTRRKIWLLFVAGLICGLIVITKQNAGGVIIALIATIGLDAYLKKDSFLRWLKQELFVVIGFLLPILGLLIYYFSQKALGDLFFYTIFMVFGVYSHTAIPQGHSFGDGIWIECGYLTFLLPFFIFRKQTRLSIQKTIFILLLTLFLFPSLLPSYHSYRAFTAYPIISVVAAYDIILLIWYFRRRNMIRLTVLIVFFIAFIVFTFRFAQAYQASIRDDGFHMGNIIRDYGDSELEAAKWIRENTKEGEKISSLGNVIIFFVSNRFPKNKYIDDATNILYPFEESSKVFMTDLPRIFVFNENILEDQPGYVDWPFYNYFKKNYIARKKFEGLIIYELSGNRDVFNKVQ